MNGKSQFLLSVAVGLLCSCGERSNRTVAILTVNAPPAGSDEIALRFASMPDNPLVVIKQPTGFSSGQAILEAYEHVTIAIEVTDTAGKSERYELGRQFSSNAGSHSSKRNDGTWDFCAQLVLWNVSNGVMKIRMHDGKNALRYPLVIEVQKLNEMPF